MTNNVFRKTPFAKRKQLWITCDAESGDAGTTAVTAAETVAIIAAETVAVTAAEQRHCLTSVFIINLKNNFYFLKTQNEINGLSLYAETLSLYAETPAA